MGSDPENHPLPISVSSVVKIPDMDGRSRITNADLDDVARVSSYDDECVTILDAWLATKTLNA
jgi:hypothetical protein